MIKYYVNLGVTILLALFSHQTLAASSVDDVRQIPVLIQYEGKWQGYISEPRLSDVLTLQVQDSHIHWPTARLYSLQLNEIAQLELLRSQVVEQLRILVSETSDDANFSAKLAQTQLEISRWKLAIPLHIELNPALASVRQSHNPKITTGQYLLVAKKRTNTVSVFALGGEVFLPHMQSRPAYDYVHQAIADSVQAPDFVWLISSNGTPSEIPIGNWNRTEAAVATGTVLFVPIEHPLIQNEFKDLNQQIKQLLVHRVSS